MKQEYNEKHPDVIAKQKEIEQVKEQMDQHDRRVERKDQGKRREARRTAELAHCASEAEIKMIDGEIKRQQKLLGAKRKTDCCDSSIASTTFRASKSRWAPSNAIIKQRKLLYDQLLQQQQKNHA